MKSSPYKTKDLKRIGLFATLWWGISGAVLLLWVWWSQIWYVRYGGTTFKDANAFSKWKAALKTEYSTVIYVRLMVYAVIIGWIILTILWLRALKRNKISYKVALKDLFLTIR